jgi:hypothetical protein
MWWLSGSAHQTHLIYRPVTNVCGVWVQSQKCGSIKEFSARMKYLWFPLGTPFLHHQKCEKS